MLMVFATAFALSAAPVPAGSAPAKPAHAEAAKQMTPGFGPQAHYAQRLDVQFTNFAAASLTERDFQLSSGDVLNGPSNGQNVEDMTYELASAANESIEGQIVLEAIPGNAEITIAFEWDAGGEAGCTVSSSDPSSIPVSNRMGVQDTENYAVCQVMIGQQ